MTTLAIHNGRVIDPALGRDGIADVVIVAPDRNRSGASNSLTLETPLRVERVEDDLYYINGTPTDCVHIAITGDLLDEPPDMLISGINHGANLGDDVLYSGTVAAAMEGRFLGIPSIAVSLVLSGGGHFDTAAALIRRLVERNAQDPLPVDSILNVNVPDVPQASLTFRYFGELIDKVKGNVNEAIGKMKQHSDNPETQAEGAAQEAKGKAQQFTGKVKGALGDDI